MRRLALSGLLQTCLFLAAGTFPGAYAAAQSTTSPQAAPSIPPGETPPAAARDPQGGADAASSDQNVPQQVSPNSDPPEHRQR